jgi:RNA polymerase sigma-70 factor (ECF subfamily)
VPTRAIAEEVVQETWLAAIEGLNRFEGRSSFRTWVFRILTNRARTRGVRESWSVPFSSIDEPAVPRERFRTADDNWPGHWAQPPRPWTDVPAEQVQSHETSSVVFETIRTLPEHQREVIALRDVEGWSAEEVCAALEISEVNQRVLLHRARSRVRLALERHFDSVVTA